MDSHLFSLLNILCNTRIYRRFKRVFIFKQEKGCRDWWYHPWARGSFIWGRTERQIHWTHHWLLPEGIHAKHLKGNENSLLRMGQIYSITPSWLLLLYCVHRFAIKTIKIRYFEIIGSIVFSILFFAGVMVPSVTRRAAKYQGRKNFWYFYGQSHSALYSLAPYCWLIYFIQVPSFNLAYWGAVW